MTKNENKVTLSDLVGQLAASIVRARVEADLETVRVAELYASSPLLRNFSIPRFRFPKADLEIPLIIAEVPKESNSDIKLPPGVIKRQAKEALLFQFKRHEIVVDQKQLKHLQNRISKITDELERSSEVAVDVFLIARTFSKELSDDISKILKQDKEKTAEFIKDYTNSLKIRLLNVRPLASGIKVIAETHKIKEIGRNAELVKLRLNLDEDAVEWALVDIDGEDTESLLPE